MHVCVCVLFVCTSLSVYACLSRGGCKAVWESVCVSLYFLCVNSTSESVCVCVCVSATGVRVGMYLSVCLFLTLSVGIVI